jgi:hypothetical protein
VHRALAYFASHSELTALPMVAIKRGLRSIVIAQFSATKLLLVRH